MLFCQEHPFWHRELPYRPHYQNWMNHRNCRKWPLPYLISFYWWRRLRVLLAGKETGDKYLINSPYIIGSISGSQSPTTPFMNLVNPPGYLSRFEGLSIIEHPHASERHCRLFIRCYINVFFVMGFYSVLVKFRFFICAVFPFWQSNTKYHKRCKLV